MPNCASGKASNHYPFNWTFKGEPAKTWQETWDFYKTNGSQPVSTNPELKKRHMVGRYAYTDAWEWHAEYTAAYALNQIVEAADQFCSASQQDALKSWLHSAMDENGWNFNHENAQGLDVYENQIASQFDVTDETWAELSRYFVRASHPQICGLQPLPNSPEIAGD